MAILRHILVGCSGAVLFDEPLYPQVLNRVLLEENAPPYVQDPDYRQRCYGMSLGERIVEAWQHTGRVLTPDLGSRLYHRTQVYYGELLKAQTRWPLIAGVVEALTDVQRQSFQVILVAPQTKIQLAPLIPSLQVYLQEIVWGDVLGFPGTVASGDLHRHALRQFSLDPKTCVSVEATYTGIAGARAAGIPVVGLATLFPFAMIQRRSQWVVDGFRQIEWERIQRWLETGRDQPPPLTASEPPPATPDHAA